MNGIPRSLASAAAFLARHSALVALAFFAVASAVVLDDYGVSVDEPNDRKIGVVNLDYILGDEDALRALREHRIDKFYGVAFKVPLIVVERALGLADSRDIYLSRRVVARAFFLAAGFFAWLLAYRLFGNRLVALFAMSLFLLHPRLHAHSFFNARDLPFLSAFMVALYLIHRAFRRDSVWAFALCGAAVGLLANIRIMGLILFPAVLGMLALDIFKREPQPTNPLPLYGGGLGWGRPAKRDIKRISVNACAFSAMFAATFYVAWPLLWSDPLNLANALEALSQHPVHVATLTSGEPVQFPNIPWNFIPSWMLATTPLAALSLAALGIGYLARLCAVRWRDALANSAARFGLLSLACLILPAAVAVALNSNLYNGWRQMYFLYAPFCVLAAFGLRALADIPKPRLRAAAFALTALGISLAVAQMIQLHPYQHEYFNELVNKSGLANRWEMDYWAVSEREALEAVLQIQPSGRVGMAGYDDGNFYILPEDDRRRLYISRHFPSFRISRENEDGENAVVWTREVYGVPIVSVVDLRAESKAAHRAIRSAARASAPLASAGGFDIYARGGELIYIKDGCGEEDARGWFALSVFPIDQDDLPQSARDAGLEYQPIHFQFYERGAIFDGVCITLRALPDFPISHIETWRDIRGEGAQWSALIRLDGYDERHRRALAALSGETPAMRSEGFDAYLKDNALTYVKAPCAKSDTRGRFFLSIFPVDPSDLPQSARAAGGEHEALNFDFHRGAIFDGKCAIIQDLPDYPISHIETGQWTPEEGGLWSARIILDGFYERYRRALAALSGESPAMRSGFDVYARDGALTYVKDPCAKSDTRGRFFLSVFPADPSDLPQSARDREFAHEPLNFDFAEYGAIFDGKCVIMRDLPDYPISRVETGQWTDGEGEIWSGEIAIGD